MYSVTFTTQYCFLLFTLLQHSINAFTILPINHHHSSSCCIISTTITSSSKGKNKNSFLQLSSSTNNDQDEETSSTPEAMSFEEATAELKRQEDQERAAARGSMFEEDSKRFQAKKTEFDEMRNRIRSRAADLNMKKSVATAEAIKEATQRAQAGEAASTPTVDLSKFSSSLGKQDEEDPEDVLTDEQKKEIDKVGQLPIWEQVKDELNNTKFPTPGATIKQAALMVVIFIVTAGIILKADEFMRILITDWGFIPRPGENLDYSDLALPEGFTDQMSDSDLAGL